MEFERNCKSLGGTKRSFTRSSSKVGLISSRTIIRNSRSIRSPSNDTISRIMFDCDSQIMLGKHLKERINRIDREISDDIGRLDRNKGKIKFYDENYIANAVRIFRDQKQAFIYKKGRFITGTKTRRAF